MKRFFSKLPLWHNSLIRIGNKPVFYKDWYLKGITKVKYLYGNSADLLSWTDFQNKYNLKVQPPTYFGIVSAINRLSKSKDLPKHDCSLKKFLDSATPSRFAYGKLISSKSEQPHICQHKWSNEINLPPDEKIDWRAVYQLAFQCTKSSKLITFNYKFLHHRLATNTFLKNIKVLEDDKCTFCHSEAESLLHFFWECEITQDFWISVFSWLNSCQIINR